MFGGRCRFWRAIGDAKLGITKYFSARSSYEK